MQNHSVKLKNCKATNYTKGHEFFRRRLRGDAGGRDEEHPVLRRSEAPLYLRHGEYVRYTLITTGTRKGGGRPLQYLYYKINNPIYDPV